MAKMDPITYLAKVAARFVPAWRMAYQVDHPTYFDPIGEKSYTIRHDAESAAGDLRCQLEIAMNAERRHIEQHQYAASFVEDLAMYQVERAGPDVGPLVVTGGIKTCLEMLLAHEGLFCESTLETCEGASWYSHNIKRIGSPIPLESREKSTGELLNIIAKYAAWLTPVEVEPKVTSETPNEARDRYCSEEKKKGRTWERIILGVEAMAKTTGCDELNSGTACLKAARRHEKKPIRS